MNKESKVISHNENTVDFKHVYNSIKDKIVKRGDLPYAAVEYQLDLLDQLSEFPFGRYLLEHKGWDGYYTNYAIMHQFTTRHTGINNEGKKFSKMEAFLLDRSPIFLSTQQRFRNFRDNLQWMIDSNKVLASVPCGMMGDLLTLDYSLYKNVKLVGLDLDKNSLKLAAESAKALNVKMELELIHCDAWNLNITEEFDVLTSNGLNIYEHDDNRVADLYKNFFNAIKPGGFIVTSAIAPPPQVDKDSPWLTERINKEDAQLEQILFKDIIGVGFAAFRTVPRNIKLMEIAGFESIEVIYDKAHIFPTYIGKKP